MLLMVIARFRFAITYVKEAFNSLYAGSLAAVLSYCDVGDINAIFRLKSTDILAMFSTDYSLIDTFVYYCSARKDNVKCQFHLVHAVIIIIISIQPLGRFGQRPELSQATGLALVRCILGKFLGVGCHYFPPL